MQTKVTVKQPVFFIPHGAGPCFFMDWNPRSTWDGMADFLRSVTGILPEKPKAIVLVSAHWCAPEFRVTAGVQPDLIYDYFGFPDHTYELTYNASGAPSLAHRVSRLLVEAQQSTLEDYERGFDHGMFIPLKVMFPEAEIPVVQLSLRQDLDPEAHLQAGRALAPLRDEGVLILASGMSFHNMRGYGDKRFTPLSEAFDDWLTNTVEGDSDVRYQLFREWFQAPYALDCHPSGNEEHFIPLLVAAGAAGTSPGKKIYSEQVMKTQLSAFQFG